MSALPLLATAPTTVTVPLPGRAVPRPRTPLRSVPAGPADRPLPQRPGGPRRSEDRPPAGREVLCALAAGDAETWRTTVRRYENLLRSTARGILRNDADVDEAVQRTWVILLRNAERIQDPDRLAGWLATTTRREALALLRGQQRETPSSEVAEQVPAVETDLAAALMDEELRAALRRAVDTLPDTQRRIVRALLREPASYDALSEELGIPRGSLGPLRGRAVRALREQLDPSLR
jgi:RNA polymerase sigma factor (sigma-70 family)